MLWMRHVVSLTLAAAVVATPSSENAPRAVPAEPAGVASVMDHAAHGAAPASASAGAGLQCLICYYSGGRHAFDLDPDFCMDDEHRENNNCRACGGSSTCHSASQEGPCHADCGPALAEEQLLVTALERGDVQQLAIMVAENALIKYNPDRRAVQVLGCRGGVKRHVSLESAIAEKLEAQLAAIE